VITGCSSGIGLETALAFARHGDRVYATMRDPERGDRLRQAAERERLAVTIAALDVTDGTAILQVVADIVEREGRIDVLVNNAGISGVASSIEEIDESVARAVWETNFFAPFRLIRAVLPHMRAQHSGVIANLSTFGARLPGARVLAMYAISKHAISRLSGRCRRSWPHRGAGGRHQVSSLPRSTTMRSAHIDPRRPARDGCHHRRGDRCWHR
jgi:NAD(P)-dependent dehydrogenase (short-subunit alcohol dehydrogenase family)